MMILYFVDETKEAKLRKEYIDSKSCVGIIMIDNYEETMQQLDIDTKPQIIAEVDKNLYEYANETEGIMIKTDKDRFVYIFEYKYLEKIKESKFAILDTIKEINIPGRNQLTLSIAISNEGKTNKEKYKTAESAMDVVLGRGGDQATIRENGKYQFFGGRVEEVEKRTKVKARIVAHALEELISESEQVIIMGHTVPDIDSLGSSLGMYRLSKKLGKQAFIVANTNTMALKNVQESLDKDEEYKDVIINGEIAEQKINENTLLIVVDTHKTSHVEVPSLLDKTNKIAIIDHHRRSPDIIEGALLNYIEVYASSTSEMVTEIIQYILKKPIIKPLEAEGLLAGIVMDTKCFQFKSGVRTFDAAAFLRELGADTLEVKKMFADSFEDYLVIAETIKNAEVENNLAIAVCPSSSSNTVIVARAADELLNISGIDVCFVLSESNGSVAISGRSVGDINVQVVLEEIGGGGHMNMAGAKLNMPMAEALSLLKESIARNIKE